MPNNTCHFLTANGTRKSKNITHAVQHEIGREVITKRHRDCRRAPIAAQIRCDGVKACLGQSRQLMSPGVGELREPVQKHDTGSSRLFETGLEDVHDEAVVVIDQARADATG
jgi:hypothetical protein